LRFQGTCWRAHNPSWAFTPLSGDGAALHGGRFNAKGVKALYLSLDFSTAILEANQGFAHKIDPCTLCTYEVDCEDIADLRDSAGRNLHAVAPAEMQCAWLAIAESGAVPPSWEIGRRLMEEGYAGILVPSFANRAPADAYNLVLWNWGSELPHRVLVFDPSGKLPRNQLSWD